MFVRSFRFLFRRRRQTYDAFVKALHDWHLNVVRNIVLGLDSHDAMHIRNTLVVLTTLHGAYPVLARTVPLLEKRIERLRGDEREDVKVMANRYSAMLQTARKDAIDDATFFGDVPYEVKVRGKEVCWCVVGSVLLMCCCCCCCCCCS